jgi:hypothetical protein
MVRRLLSRAEAADSRYKRSSALNETLTKGLSAESPAMISSMSARQFSSAAPASISLCMIAPPAKLIWALFSGPKQRSFCGLVQGNGHFLDFRREIKHRQHQRHRHRRDTRQTQEGSRNNAPAGSSSRAMKMKSLRSFTSPWPVDDLKSNIQVL